MPEIEKLILQRLLITLKLNKARMEFGNSYVVGFDDVEIIIKSEIDKLEEEGYEAVNGMDNCIIN